MEFIIVAVCFTLGAAVMKWGTERRWKANADVPARPLSGKVFYKVVRLDSDLSWEMLKIHEKDKET